MKHVEQINVEGCCKTVQKIIDKEIYQTDKSLRTLNVNQVRALQFLLRVAKEWENMVKEKTRNA
jgi:hypothetical protein